MSTTPLGLVVVIEFETDVLIGAGTTIGTLMKEDGFDAVFVSTGAGLPRFPGVPGEDLIGVYSVNEFLTRVNLMRAYEAGAETPVYDLAGRPVAVVGGGNTAMDAARTALRLGGDPVTLFYRRTDDEMPARREEIEHAREEGVNFSFLCPRSASRARTGGYGPCRCRRWSSESPTRMGAAARCPSRARWSRCEPMSPSSPSATPPTRCFRRATPGLEATSRGTVVTDPETGATSIPGVFAGGDISTGGATVVLAMGAGRRAAAAIDTYLGDTGDVPGEPS